MITLITRMIGEKRRWWQYKARTKQLPATYREAIDAIERYTMYASGIADGNLMMTMLEDLADLFEESAANGTPVRAIVGEDPVEFTETFLRNYSEGHWIAKERQRLNAAIDRAAGSDQ